MPGIMSVLSYGIGTILGFAFVGLLVFWFVALSRGAEVAGCWLDTLRRRLVSVSSGGQRRCNVNYVSNMNKEIDMIAHSCGCRHSRELRREHVRIVDSADRSVAFNMLYHYPQTKNRLQTEKYPARSS